MSDLIQPVPGIVGVLIGCPEGCGETIPVLLWKDAVQTLPATQGRVTATVQIDPGSLVNALAEHIAEFHTAEGDPR